MDNNALLALRQELGAKLPEERYCEMDTIYALCSALLSNDCAESLEHLVTVHGDLPAAELLGAVMAYLAHASRNEAEVFAQYRITSKTRFDAEADSQSALEVQAMVESMRTVQPTRH